MQAPFPFACKATENIPDFLFRCAALADSGQVTEQVHNRAERLSNSVSGIARINKVGTIVSRENKASISAAGCRKSLVRSDDRRGAAWSGAGALRP